MIKTKLYKLVILLALITFSSSTYPQTKGTKIGDSFDYNIEVQVLNKAPINLQEFKDQLLIIDFFNSGCAPCIKAMPHNIQLEEEFKGQLKILSVTFEDKEITEKLFNNIKLLKDNKVAERTPIVYADEKLKALFPYKGVTHLVWIYQGIVKAITVGQMLDKSIIQKVLDGEDISNWPLKDDYYIFAES